MELSRVQERALMKLSCNKWQSPYDLEESIVTLNILCHKGLAKKRGYGKSGMCFSPRTIFEYIRLI